MGCTHRLVMVFPTRRATMVGASAPELGCPLGLLKSRAEPEGWRQIKRMRCSHENPPLHVGSASVLLKTLVQDSPPLDIFWMAQLRFSLDQQPSHSFVTTVSPRPLFSKPWEAAAIRGDLWKGTELAAADTVSLDVTFSENPLSPWSRHGLASW